MSVRRAAAMMLAGVVLAASIGCGRGLFRQYEYEEEIYLRLDGSADIVVNTSIPALVALRGADLSTDPRATVDRVKVRALYQSPGTTVTRVSRPWRRAGRRFVQVRLTTANIRTLAQAAPFAWSAYRFDARDGLYVYRQIVAKPSGAIPANANWNGSEIVAVRMHIPSRIRYHNAPSHEVERGNIVSWEQPLRDRLAGRPLDVEVRMETESILSRTLLIFGISAAAALTLLAAIVFWVRRAGRSAAA
jgi:hypothetical protein